MTFPARPIPEGAVLIPEDATRVFSGEIFDVYQWPQKMFDGSMATFEMIKRPDTVLVLALDEDGKVIILNESQPGLGPWSYSMPGGRVDAEDASVLDAAKREMKEETGYEFASWKLIDMVQPQRKIEWFVYTFFAETITQKGATAHDAGEKIEVVHVDYEEFIENSKDARRSEVLSSHKTLDELRALELKFSR